MKKIFQFVAVSALMLGMTACVNDLNVEPKDPNLVMEFDQNAVFTKIYSTFATTGQKGPDGNGDVAGIDEGTSAFYRMFWELNEFPTDEGWWIWGDPGIPEVREIKWTSTNTLVAGLYYRLYFDITLCNHFLEMATGTDERTLTQRAEVEFIRAFNYWYLLDMFGSVPLATDMKAENIKQVDRTELYNWVEQQLLAVEQTLPETRLSLYRVDKVAAQLLLARLYLNAEVYTGTPQWTKAAEYADKVINSNYKLYTDNSGKYTAYQKLFMGDNNKNGAQNEAVFMIYQDGVNTQSWGGARFLVNAVRDAGFNSCGSTDSWSCFRSSPELVYVFFDKSKAASVTADEFEMPAKAGDNRCILASKPNDKKYNLKGDMSSEFDACWAILKWTGRYSTEEKGNDVAFPDTDIPLLRAAEAYLTYAEAVYRDPSASKGMTAEQAIQALRDRAQNTTEFTIDDAFLRDEWAREFYAEGRRRTDLIRLGYFTDRKDSYSWEGRGGRKTGEMPAKIKAKYSTFPIPEADIVASGLHQTNGWE